MLGADRIFVSPELAQALFEELIQPKGCIAMGNGVMEPVPAADAGHPLPDELLPGSLDEGHRTARTFGRGLWNKDSLGELLAVVGIETPAATNRTTIRIDQQIQSLALHLVEATHQGLLAGGEMVLDDGLWSEQHRGGDDLQTAAVAGGEGGDPLAQNIVHRIRQMKGPVALIEQITKDLSGAGRLPLEHPQHGEALGLKHLGIGIHRGPMQKQALPMQLDRPAGISAEQQRIFDQGHGPSRPKRGMVLKQLMGKNETEIHRQLSSPARRQARRPRAVA